MLEIRSILIFLSCTTCIECLMEPNIVGGVKADIRSFPHSTFAYIKCFEGSSIQSLNWICGGSIINERIILTAAHCIYGCSRKSNFTVSVGHGHLKKGSVSAVRNFFIHASYNSETTSNDLALMRVRTAIKFTANVKRVALSNDPPYYEQAHTAGWGMINVSTFCFHSLSWLERNNTQLYVCYY